MFCSWYKFYHMIVFILKFYDISSNPQVKTESKIFLSSLPYLPFYLFNIICNIWYFLPHLSLTVNVMSQTNRLFIILSPLLVVELLFVRNATCLLQWDEHMVRLPDRKVFSFSGFLRLIRHSWPLKFNRSVCIILLIFPLYSFSPIGQSFGRVQTEKSGKAGKFYTGTLYKFTGTLRKKMP